ncbi:MAG: UDP-3-O-(3-hydroxymyristoyl)glucosamine N-acyltransferase [candidate division NC10 bacterium RIFCSPLOWO2_02_FULL_66_22]|nr:MAG: UDP-3-O-(3-hydroxymyristoyl)glucosamine N-acyltransferase [candidate division NC10 bacterium RIFCSPLOWO2_02_FULL_66_22]
MPGPFTLAQIATRLGGRIAGDPQTLIRQVGSLERAGRGEIAFLANPTYRSRLAGTGASAIVLSADAEALTALPRIVCDNPYAYFARVSQLFNPRTTQPEGVHPSASVAPGARLAARLSIGAGCVIGEGVEIGEDSCLYPGVVVYPGCRIGARAIIHSGVVIGADGFGIANDGGQWVKIPQIGAVAIGDDVEIGANTTIDRGAMQDTVIEDGVKLDNQIQIGHNCRIGAHTAMAGCVAVAGSADIGSHCTIGAGALILGHLSICDHVHVSADTVISHSIRKPGTYTGMFPADDNAAWARNTAVVRHLAELADRVRELEKRLNGKESGNG